MTIQDAARQLRDAGYVTRHVAGGYAIASRWTGRNHLLVEISPTRSGRSIVRSFMTGAQPRVVDWETTQTLTGIVELAITWAHNVDVVHAQFSYVLSEDCPTFDPVVLLFAAMDTLDVAA
jgi:hypothetical protein